MKIPDKILTYYEEFKYKNYYGSKDIYISFSDEQMGVIKQYFKWVTKKKVNKLTKNTVLQAKPSKGEKLLEFVKLADDWAYNGTIDTGCMGGGACTLGHKLRYEHYAFSRKLNKEIIFGSTCASDFFSIPKTILNNIRGVQEEVLEEMKFIAFINQTGNLKWYIENYYQDAADIFRGLSEYNLFEEVDTDLFGAIRAFILKQVPLTETMVNNLNKARQLVLDTKREKAEVLAVKDLVSDLEGVEEVLSPKCKLHICELARKSVRNYVNLKGKHYQTSLLGSSNAEEQENKCKRLLTNAVLVNKSFKILCQDGILDSDKLKSSISDLLYTFEFQVAYVDAENGRRIATKNEFNNNRISLEYEKVRLLEPDYWKMLNSLLWSITGEDKYLYAITKENKISLELYRYLENSTCWVISGQFTRCYVQALKDKENYEYLDSAEDENIGFEGEKLMLSELNKTITDKMCEHISLLKICKSIIRNTDIEDMSSKQLALLSKCHKLLNDTETKSLINGIITILESSNTVRKELKIEFACKVAETVSNSLKASPKQTDIIEEAYKKLAKYYNIDEEKAMQEKESSRLLTGRDDRAGSINSSGGWELNNKVSLEDIIDAHIGTNDDQVDANKEKKGNFEKPSIVDMYNMLGNGALS